MPICAAPVLGKMERMIRGSSGLNKCSGLLGKQAREQGQKQQEQGNGVMELKKECSANGTPK